MTQPAQQQHIEAADSLLDETSGVEVRHSFIRPKQPCVPGADAVPSFLIRQTEDQFVLPRLLAWTTLGLLAYVAVEAGTSTYHFMRDARVTPLAAAHIRGELHALLDEVARKQPAAAHPAARIAAAQSGPARADDETPAPSLAFVPYTHVPNIKANATLYDCRVLSMFACTPVGRVVELLPGEVAETDPAGTQARGQYAVMQLTDPSAAEADSLSVRDPLAVENGQGPLDGLTHAETLL